MENRWKINLKRLCSFHIVLGTLQTPPERESLIFQWISAIWVGRCQGRAKACGGLSHPFNHLKKHQTPLALARALALPLALALAKGKHKHKGKGKHVWASMFGHPLTPSRRARWRIRRPTGDERARSPCKVCPKSLSKVSVQSLCPKSLSKVSVNPLQVLPRPRTLRVRRSSWTPVRPLGAHLGRKSCLPKRLRTNFKKCCFS